MQDVQNAYLRSIREFGNVDAEVDPVLSQAFITNIPYRRLETQERLVIVGNGGSGKSALARKLAERAKQWDNGFLRTVSFKDYPWRTHNQASLDNHDLESHASTWEFMLLLELAKIILFDTKHPRDPRSDSDKAYRQLKRFVRRNYGNRPSSFADTFRPDEYSFTLEPSGLGFKLGSLSLKKTPRDQLSHKLPIVNGWLRDRVARAATRNGWYVVLFDDLDRAPDGGSSLLTHASALVVAARDLHLWGRQMGLRVAPVVLMSEDLYEDMHFGGKSRATWALTERLRWSPRGPGSIFELLNERISQVMSLTPSDAWSQVFEPADATFDYLVERTMNRPRDAILYANLALTAAKEAGAGYVTLDHLRAAESEYSRYLLDEASTSPNVRQRPTVEHLSALRMVNPDDFSEREFVDAHRSECENDCRVSDVIEQLFRRGILGIKQAANYSYTYEQSHVSADLLGARLGVHPGIRAALYGKSL